MHKIISGFLLWVSVLSVASAVQLQGVASVNITSDTAANAKNIAFDEARRQIIADALRSYADADALQGVIKNAKSAFLSFGDGGEAFFVIMSYSLSFRALSTLLI